MSLMCGPLTHLQPLGVLGFPADLGVFDTIVPVAVCTGVLVLFSGFPVDFGVFVELVLRATIGVFKREGEFSLDLARVGNCCHF